MKPIRITIACLFGLLLATTAACPSQAPAPRPPVIDDSGDVGGGFCTPNSCPFPRQ